MDLVQRSEGFLLATLVAVVIHLRNVHVVKALTSLLETASVDHYLVEDWIREMDGFLMIVDTHEALDHPGSRSIVSPTALIDILSRVESNTPLVNQT
jgi:hypothetical protein